MELYFMIIIPIFAALLLYLFPVRISYYITAGIYAALLGVSSHIFYRVRFGGELITAQTGAGGLLSIPLYCDLTAAVFLVLVTFLFFCLFLYTFRKSYADRLYSFLFTVLCGLVMLLFLSRDIFNLYVAIEVSVVVCSILIMFKRESRSMYDGLVYFILNTSGMLFFLLGIGLLYRQTGMLDLSLIEQGLQGYSKRELALPYACIMTGASLKCALVPVHFWLPHAHGTPGAPAEVSAVLSGIYIKGGIYLMIRMQTMFSGVFDTSEFFLWLGIVTAVAGIVMAVCQKDIKLILAYHTISQVGLIVAGLNLNSGYGVAGAMLHIINHAVFKSLLFLAAGVIIKHYGTRNVYKMKGVMKTLPFAGVAVAAGILGITGAPFFNGSISKYLIQKGGEVLVVEVLFYLINFGTALSFVKFGQILFGNCRCEAGTEPAVRTEPTAGKASEAGKESAASKAAAAGKAPEAGKMIPVKESVSLTEAAVLITLSALCLATGILAEPFTELIFGTRMEIDPAAYLAKSGAWLLTIAAAYGFYRLVLSKIKRLKKGISFMPGLNAGCLWMLACFAANFLAALI